MSSRCFNSWERIKITLYCSRRRRVEVLVQSLGISIKYPTVFNTYTKTLYLLYRPDALPVSHCTSFSNDNHSREKMNKMTGNLHRFLYTTATNHLNFHFQSTNLHPYVIIITSQLQCTPLSSILGCPHLVPARHVGCSYPAPASHVA